MSKCLNGVPLRDEQDPSIKTDAGVVFHAMKDRYRRVFERAALRKLMEAYEARASAAAHGHTVAYAAEAQAAEATAMALLDEALSAELPCRPLERLDRIARRKLRRRYTRILARHEQMLQTHAAQGIEDGDDWNVYSEQRTIWELKTLLHLVDEPAIPDIW